MSTRMFGRISKNRRLLAMFGPLFVVLLLESVYSPAARCGIFAQVGPSLSEGVPPGLIVCISFGCAGGGGGGGLVLDAPKEETKTNEARGHVCHNQSLGR